MFQPVKSAFVEREGALLNSNYGGDRGADLLQQRLDRDSWANSLTGIGMGALIVSFFAMSDSFIWGTWEPWWVLDWSLFISWTVFLFGLLHAIGHAKDERLFQESRTTEYPYLTNFRRTWAIWAASLNVLSGLLFPDWWFPSSQYTYPTSDPWFSTCQEAKNFGYGPYYKYIDGEYEWYVDRDSDGIVCE